MVGAISATSSRLRREVRSWYSGDEPDLLDVGTMAIPAGYGPIRYTAFPRVVRGAALGRIRPAGWTDAEPGCPLRRKWRRVGDWPAARGSEARFGEVPCPTLRSCLGCRLFRNSGRVAAALPVSFCSRTAAGKFSPGTPYNKPLNQTDRLSSWERSPPRKLRTRIERRARLELLGVDWLYL